MAVNHPANGTWVAEPEPDPATVDFRQTVKAAADPLQRFGLQDSDEVALGGITLGLFSESGGGKTTIAATAIDYFKQAVHPQVKSLYLDAEGGLRPIRSRGDFRFKALTSWKDFADITSALIQMPNLREVHPVIVVDNMTEFSDLSMIEVCRQNRVEEPGWPEWRKNSRIVVTQIRKLRDAARLHRICIIINLWNREDSDTSGNVRKVGVELNPALARLFVGAVDIVGFLEVADDDGRRVLHLGQNSRVKAKFRQDMADPTIRGIPLDIYGPPAPQILSLAPLMATLIGGEPFPVADYAAPQGLNPSRFASKPKIDATQTALDVAQLSGKGPRPAPRERALPPTTFDEKGRPGSNPLTPGIFTGAGGSLGGTTKPKTRERVKPHGTA